MATAYGKRPSDYFQFETELAAWQLDEACLMAGRRIENDLNNKKDPFRKRTKSRDAYQGSAGRRLKKMKIPKRGVR